MTSTNISSSERHSIIVYYPFIRETELDNDKLCLTKVKWRGLLKDLQFTDTAAFLSWLFNEIKIHKALWHNTLPGTVPSTYPFTIKALSRLIHHYYPNEYIDELKKAYESLTELSMNPLDFHLHVELRQAKELIVKREIEIELPDFDWKSVFPPDKKALKAIIDRLPAEISTPETWRGLFKSTARGRILTGVKRATELYMDSPSISLKSLIQGFYFLIQDFKDKKIIELTDWILSNIDEEDIPFITTNYSAKTTSEYLYLLKTDNDIKKFLDKEHGEIRPRLKKHSDRIQSLEDEILQHKNQITKTKIHLKSLQDNSDRIKKLEQLTGLNPKERLLKIIRGRRSLLFYPDIFFKDIGKIVPELSQKDIGVLKKKLKYVKKGLLREFEKTILNEMNT